MKQRLNWLRRLIGTAVAFSVFGAGGIVFLLVLMPILFVLPGTALKREQRAKTAIHYGFRCFVELMRLLGLLTYNVEQRDLLNRPGQLILANHPTLVDVVFLIGFIKSADCVVKSKLLHNPVMIGAIKGANYIANENSERVIEQAKDSMDRGNSLIVFPEGTRTTPGQPLEMKRGAANIALRCGRPITPVVITCSPSTLTKDLKWYQIPSRPFHVELKLQPELSIAPFLNNEIPSRAARQLTRFLEQYFTQELNKA